MCYKKAEILDFGFSFIVTKITFQVLEFGISVLEFLFSFFGIWNFHIGISIFLMSNHHIITIRDCNFIFDESFSDI